MTLVSRSCFISIYFFVLKKKSTVHDIKIKRYFSNMENKCRGVKKQIVQIPEFVKNNVSGDRKRDCGNNKGSKI